MSALGRKYEHQEPRRPYQAPRSAFAGLIFATLPSLALWLLAGANSRSVALDPVAATPSGLPSVDQVARTLFATDHPDADQHILDLIRRELSADARARYDKKARAVLALFEAAVPSVKAEAWDEGWQAAIDAVFGTVEKPRSVPRITYVIPPNPYLTEGAKP